MKKVKRSLKILYINAGVLLMGVLLIELIFGGWLSKANRLDGLFIVRDKVIEIDLNGLYPYHKTSISVTKDRYGFRGGPSTYNHPEAIDILCIGGSTTQQAYIEDGYTWPDVLENELRVNGYGFNVANAGIDGQSTFGHIKSFELWFSEVPDLEPEYIFFYVGINDLYREKSLPGSDELERTGFLARARGKIKDNSALYGLFRNISGRMEANRSELTHGNADFENHTYGTEGLIPESEQDDFHIQGLAAYEERLRLLVKYSKELGSTPVFITQPSRRFKFDEKGEVLGLAAPFKRRISGYQFNGVDYYRGLVELNSVTEKVAEANNLLVIEQTRLETLTDECFYDFTHTTPLGSKVIGEHIASGFINFLSNGQCE